MGWFKNLFGKRSITLSKEQKDDFISPVKLKGNSLNIDGKLSVPEGFSAVIVCKGKPMEVFNAGEHVLGLAYIPKITKALNLSKGKVVRRKNSVNVVLPKKFKADLYYVNLKEFLGQVWETSGVEVKSKTYGYFSYRANGVFGFRVKDPTHAVKLFLIDWAVIRPGRALHKVRYYFGDVAAGIFRTGRHEEPEQIMDYELMSKGLAEKVGKEFLKYGIEITGAELIGIHLPKDVSRRIAEVTGAEADGAEALVDNDNKYQAPEYAPPEDRAAFYDTALSEPETFEQKLERLGKKFDERVAVTTVETGKPKIFEEEQNFNFETKNSPSSKGWTPEADGVAAEGAKPDSMHTIPPAEADSPASVPAASTRRRSLPLCSGCGAILPVGSKYCTECGTDNGGKKKICPECGAENNEDALFCGCGAYLQ
ncbi:MAG: SPFH domain-containing protein [Firmicutes bacterium]|nr:SPFH domain-containing protein [Bacillota bacterium]